MTRDPNDEPAMPLPHEITLAAKAALNAHVMCVFAGDNETLDVDALVKDKRVPTSLIAQAVSNLSGEFERPMPRFERDDRRAAATALAGELEAVHTQLSHQHSVVEISAAEPADRFETEPGNGAMHRTTEKKEAMKRGDPATVTRRVMRGIRWSMGWVPLSSVSQQTKSGWYSRRAIVDELRDEAIAGYMRQDKWLTRAQAEEKCGLEYIHQETLVVPEEKIRKKNAHTYTDLSPQAAMDYADRFIRRRDSKTAARSEMESGRWRTFAEVLQEGGIGSKRSEFSHNRVRIFDEIGALRQRHIDMLAQEYGDVAQAKRATDETYISRAPDRFNPNYHIYPPALDAVRAIIKEAIPSYRIETQERSL